jgi:hypothetical protein
MGIGICHLLWRPDINVRSNLAIYAIAAIMISVILGTTSWTVKWAAVGVAGLATLAISWGGQK